VVASRIGQLAELIQHERNGLLVPPGDPPALAAALERLWRHPDLRQRLGQAGRAMVLRSHTWEAVARRILDLAGGEFALPSASGRAGPGVLTSGKSPVARPGLIAQSGAGT
jgi:hypothetical protein